jgi:hypothetical protein
MREATQVGSRRISLALAAATIAIPLWLGFGSEAEAVIFKIKVTGIQQQVYDVSGSSPYGGCDRNGQGDQTVGYITKTVRVNIVKGKGGYQFVTGKRRLHGALLPIEVASVDRNDQTYRTSGQCELEGEGGTLVPPPPKDCRAGVDITNTMAPLLLFLGRRASLEGGGFFIGEDPNGDLTGDSPFDNCLAFRHEGFVSIGDAFYNEAHSQKLPANLLTRKSWQGNAHTGSKRVPYVSFTTQLGGIGTNPNAFNGAYRPTSGVDWERVGSSVRAFERALWIVRLRRAGK